MTEGEQSEAGRNNRGSSKGRGPGRGRGRSSQSSSNSSTDADTAGRGSGRRAPGGRHHGRGGRGNRNQTNKNKKPFKNKKDEDLQGNQNVASSEAQPSVNNTDEISSTQPNSGRGRGRGHRHHGRPFSRGGWDRGRSSRSRGRGRGRSSSKDAEIEDVLEKNTNSHESNPDESVINGESGDEVRNAEIDPMASSDRPMVTEDSATVQSNIGSTVGTEQIAQTLAPAASKKNAKFMILSRDTGLPNETEGVQELSQAAKSTEKQPPKSKKKQKSRKVKKDQAVASEEDPLSTTDALKALPAQEVSITASTAVKLRPVDQSIDVDGNQKARKVSAKDKKKSKKKKKALSGDAEANRRAVQLFNRHVQQCVTSNDPEGLRELIQDPRNHNFALDAIVLEMVMKATIMAAMFDDALYCLRHCTLPGTLQTVQTERILSCLPQNLRNSSAYTAADMINALCIATEFDKPTSRAYFFRIVRGISLEFLEEATSARDRICSSPCERLVRSGMCVVNAIFKRGKKPTDLVVIPGDQLGVFVSDAMENRGIQAGDAVSILPYAGPYPMSAESLDRNMIEGTVTNMNPMVLRLQDKANAKLFAMLTEPLDGNLYRIDKLANRMGFNRQLAAAIAIASPIEDSPIRDTRRPSPELIRAITAMDENIDRVMKSSHSGVPPQAELSTTATLCSLAIPMNPEDDGKNLDQDTIRAEYRLALEKFGAFDGLNDSQKLAVEGCSSTLSLVQGPPGTGKTKIAIRILQTWAQIAQASASKGEAPSPILATSDSNIAVDNLVEGCASVGLRVVRLGRPEAIRPELLKYCINNEDRGKGPNGGSSAAAHRERVKQIRNELKNAQVICCTCIGSGGDILDSIPSFDRVLVDEATQGTEPAVLVPLMRGCRQLVLVGDHCQLPPTVLSTRAEEEGHGVPLFSRLVACGVPPYMLDTQYRMHPRIAMFPSDLFYGGLLKNGVSAPERRPLAGFPFPVAEFPVAFIPIKGIEMDDGVSKYNEEEAVAACNAVAMLMSGGQCNVSDIAVVTPVRSTTQ